MITSSPFFQFTGVATLCLAVSCMESSTRRISSKLRTTDREATLLPCLLQRLQNLVKAKASHLLAWRKLFKCCQESAYILLCGYE